MRALYFISCFDTVCPQKLSKIFEGFLCIYDEVDLFSIFFSLF